MIIFYTQFTGQETTEVKRFDRIKKKMGQLYQKEQKQKAKEGQKLIIKAGQNWFAVHQFI